MGADHRAPVTDYMQEATTTDSTPPAWFVEYHAKVDERIGALAATVQAQDREILSLRTMVKELREELREASPSVMSTSQRRSPTPGSVSAAATKRATTERSRPASRSPPVASKTVSSRAVSRAAAATQPPRSREAHKVSEVPTDTDKQASISSTKVNHTAKMASSCSTVTQRTVTPQPVRLTPTALVAADARRSQLQRLDVDLREGIWEQCYNHLPTLMRMACVCVNFYCQLYDGNTSVIARVAEWKRREVMAIRDEAEADLAKALPALQAAERGLDVLSKPAITEMTSFSNPPALVGLIAEAVLTMLNESSKDVVSWKEFRTQARRPNFMSRLLNFDKDSISEGKLRRVSKYVQEIDVDTARRVSLAGAGLAQWLCGINTYATIAREVCPKRDCLRASMEELS